MSTPGNYGFLLDGERLMAFTRFDAYPESLGRKLAQYVIDADLDSLRERLGRVEQIPDECPVDDYVIDKLTELEHIHGIHVTSYGNSRLYDVHAESYREFASSGWHEPFYFLELGVFPLSEDFYTDNHDTVWEYVIDLDNEEFCIYQANTGYPPSRVFKFDELPEMMVRFHQLSEEIYEEDN